MSLDGRFIGLILLIALVELFCLAGLIKAAGTGSIMTISTSTRGHHSKRRTMRTTGVTLCLNGLATGLRKTGRSLQFFPLCEKRGTSKHLERLLISPCCLACRATFLQMPRPDRKKIGVSTQTPENAIRLRRLWKRQSSLTVLRMR